MNLNSSAVEGHRVAVKQKLAEFKKQQGVHFIVSISGGAEEGNLLAAQTIIEEAVTLLRDLHITVLTGGTRGGIPELGIRVAKRLDIPTVGVYPPRAKKYVLFELLDLTIECLPPSYGEASFGTETPTFAQLPDASIIIGGSYGTLAEVATMLKTNSRRAKKGIRPVYLCPISNTGGVADLFPTLLTLSSDTREWTSTAPVYTGIEAAGFIKGKLTKEHPKQGR